MSYFEILHWYIGLEVVIIFLDYETQSVLSAKRWEEKVVLYKIKVIKVSNLDVN